MTFIKKIISVFSSPKEISEKVSKNEEHFQNAKINDFLNGKTTTISSKELFPDLKVFQSVKTPKNASIEEVEVRLKNAIYFLHLPAAYKDILVSLRMIIRIKRKEGRQYLPELELLYKYACQYNFLNSKPYLEKAQEPAFNLTEVIDDDEFNSLLMPYKELGYTAITELTKTDVKWLVSEFGEPEKHISVSNYYKSKREELEILLIAKRRKENDDLSYLIKNKYE